MTPAAPATLAVQLVTFDGERYLSHCLASLRAQTDAAWDLFVRDHSADAETARRTEALVVHHMKGHAGRMVFTHDAANPGFAGGHQALFASHKAALALVVNQDAVLEPEYIADVRAAFADSRVGAASGLIRRCRFAAGGVVRLNEIDSSGMRILRSRRVVEIDSDEALLGASSTATRGAVSVFGVSGAVAMYRRAAIETTEMHGRLYDPAYWMYKEDVDVALRLRRGGWRSVVVASAVAYHGRTLSRDARGKASRRAIAYSYRNHLWNVLSHTRAEEWRRDGWVIVGYEALKALYMGVTRPRVLCWAWRDTARAWKKLTEKRRFYARMAQRA